MPDTSPDTLNSMTPALLQTMLDAGKVVMEVFDTDFDVFGKDDKSPVTEADRRGEVVIEAALKEIAPNIPIVGEEAKSEGHCPDISGGVFWLVDPLDGTKEFIKRGADFTVNIGLIKDGAPIAGFVLAPALKKMYWGIKGVGAWIADVDGNDLANKQEISARSADPDNLVIVASKSHRSPELEAWLSHFPTAEHVSIGSSLKLCLIATGEADLYPRLGPTCEWDTAAAHAVLVAAGGTVEVNGGAPLSYAKDLKTFLNPWFLCRADESFAVPAIGEPA